MPNPKDTKKSHEFFIAGYDKEAIKARVYELLDTYGDGVRDKIKTERTIRLRFFQENNGEVKVTVHKIRHYPSTKLRYSEDGKTLESADKDITIAILNDNVEVIEENAFENCERLTTVFIPSHLKLIKAYAFDGCKQLRNINIPNSVTEIESFAFNNCESLKFLYFGEQLQHLGGFAFAGSGVSFITLYEDTNTDNGIAYNRAWNLSLINIIRTEEDQHGGYSLSPSQCDFSLGKPHILITRESKCFRNSYDGVLVEIFYNDEEDKEEKVVTAVPDDVMIIPTCANILDRYCLGTARSCPLLYIPDSIDKIEMDVLPFYKGFLVTEKDNLNKLLSILPSDNNDNDIVIV